MSGLLAVLVLTCCMICDRIEGKMSCIGEDGTAVDTYVLYKLPEIVWTKVPDLVRNGSAYAYLDFTKSEKFSLSSTPITSADSAAGRTLNQVYKAFSGNNVEGPTDQAHVFYNDENPEGKEFFEHGHTKGVLAFDGETGFWLVHSVPRYPPNIADGYGYPSSGHRYGQMYFCLTVNASVVNALGLQLRYNNPHIHDSNLPESMQETFPNIDQLVKGKMIKTAPYKHLQPFISLGNMEFMSFAKGTDFGDDLYNGYVAPTLASDLLTETWQHGSSNIGSSCDGQYTVEDIAEINVKVSGGSNYSFHNSNDHSKFAVGKKNPYVCIGDINRQTSQFKRGGGTVCTQHQGLWTAFQGLVSKINACSNDILV